MENESEMKLTVAQALLPISPDHAVKLMRRYHEVRLLRDKDIRALARWAAGHHPDETESE
jgi:hypothetical protein